LIAVCYVFTIILVCLHLNSVAEYLKIDDILLQRNVIWRIRHASRKELQVFDGPIDLLMVEFQQTVYCALMLMHNLVFTVFC
jgi:hypothetical protein